MNVIGKITQKEYQLKDGTKTVWEEVNHFLKEITEREYENLTCKDTLKFFRSLGGSEHLTRCYTTRGYRVVKLVSKNPTRTIKTVREFEFY